MLDQDRDFLRFIESHNLKPGQLIEVEARDTASDSVRLRGRDEQRITSKDTRYFDVTFKHLLLPVWLSAYRYREQPYRFMINARTGEVTGERPWSWIKITLAVIAALIVIGTIVFFMQQSG